MKHADRCRHIIDRVGFEKTTKTVPPSTVLSVIATNATASKQILQLALLLITDNVYNTSYITSSVARKHCCF